MITPDSAVLKIMGWIANRLGFDLDLQEDGFFDSLEEREITEQLHHGRD